MSPSRRPAKGASTKQKILDVAIELFSSRGYHESSMRDIAARVGIEAASLYSHFKNKEAILRAILDDYRGQVAKMRLTDAQLEAIVAAHSAETILVEGFRAIQKGVSGLRTERILRILFNEMFKNPMVGAFGLDCMRETNLRELARIFACMRRNGRIGEVDEEFASLLFNALVNNYFHELFVLRACGRPTHALEQRTLAQFARLARLLSQGESNQRPR